MVTGNPENFIKRFSSPVLHLVVFSILVIMLPFTMVNLYGQSSIKLISHLELKVFGTGLPVIPVLFFMTVFLIVLGALRKGQFTRRRILVGLGIFSMVAYGQVVQDFYLDLSFFDIQNNWHYIAYTAFVFVFMRAMKKFIVSESKLIIFCYIAALCLSTFDETFQLFLSNRIFDISDIAKDSWGVIIGLIVYFFMLNEQHRIDIRLLFRKRNDSGDKEEKFFKAMFFVGIYALVLISVSAVLTGHRYILTVIVITTVLFLLIYSVLCLARIGLVRRILYAFIPLLVLAQVGAFMVFSDNNIMLNRKGLTVYRGITVPFFDLLIYPDGKFRLVDKKLSFNNADKEFLMKQGPSIILIGTGAEGRGGNGFDKSRVFYFMYNKRTKKGVQVILMDTQKACAKFNKLKREGKKVLFVLHNS